MMDSKGQDHHQNGSDVHQPQHHPPQTVQPSQGPPMYPFNHSSSSSNSHFSIGMAGMGLAPNPQQQYPDPAQPQGPMTLDMLEDLRQMSIPGISPPQGPTTPSSSQMAAGTASPLTYNPQALLDQQYRLSQLQQLQYLQQQIFQQQIALISGQVPNLVNAPSSFEPQRDHQLFTVNGLPTPAPSGELRPQQRSLDFMSPMALNAFIDSTTSQQQPRVHHTQQSLPSSPLSHSMPGSILSSPVFLGNTNTQLQSPATYSSASFLPSGPLPAPEYATFQTSPSQNGLSPPTELDLDISPLTSPWLGADPNQQITLFQNQNQMRDHQQRTGGSHSQYPSAPIPAPMPTPNINNGLNTNNKRSASPTTGESDARKRQSPAVLPTNPTTFSPLHDPPQPPARRSHRAGNRSTSSTPHLRSRAASSRQRKGSTATDSINDAPGDSPSPVDLSMPPPAPPPPPNPALLPSGTNNLSSLSAIDPPQQGSEASRLTPVTPASIMNLDVKGGRLKIVTGASNPAGSGGMPSPVGSRTKRGIQGGLSGGTPWISPSLKPILPSPGNGSIPTTPISPPGPNPSSSSTSSRPPASTSGSSMLPPQIRKTSHKAAEQKRRDSLKTTFDELRGLLPPIPLPSTSGGQGGDEEGIPASGANTAVIGGTAGASGTVFGNTVKPLLPGALPPRGPPKAGGEGPNKGVSKLQLLICGNEYIRTLKGRVERRDDEIARLRSAVKKMRQLMVVLSTDGRMTEEANLGLGVDATQDVVAAEIATMSVEELMAQMDLDLDLDRDLDVVEKTGLNGSGERREDMSSARSDMTFEEDPADYDDD